MNCVDQIDLTLDIKDLIVKDTNTLDLALVGRCLQKNQSMWSLSCEYITKIGKRMEVQMKVVDHSTIVFNFEDPINMELC